MIKIPSKFKFKIKINKDFFYLATLFIFSFIQIISQSMFYLFTIYSIVKIVVLFALVLITVNRLRLNKIFMCVSTVILVIMAISSYITDRVYIFQSALFIINAYNIDFNKIVKTSILSSVLSVFIVVASSYAGIIPDRTFLRTGSIAHCLGFTYYSTYPYVVMFIMLGYMYLRKKMNWFEILVFFVLNSYVYKMSTLRLSYYLSIVGLIMYVILCKFDVGNINNKIVKYCSALSYPLTFIFTILCALKYNSKNHLWRKLDDVFSSRISLSQEGFLRYNVKLFGQYIDVNTMNNGKFVLDYFYIDSGFIYSILGYGVLFSVLITLMYVMIFSYCCDKNDKKMFVWCSILLAFTVVNNVWVSIHINCLLLVFIYVLRYYYIDKRKLSTLEFLKKSYNYIYTNE